MPRATCPDNAEHDRFITVAHVSEDWVVDRGGEFIARHGDGEVLAGPREGNTWTCAVCGAQAEVGG